MATKMSPNMFPQKCSEAKKSSRPGPDVRRDKGRRFARRLPQRIAAVFVPIFFSRLFTFSYAWVASSQRGLKIHRGMGIGWAPSRDCMAVSSCACVKNATDEVWVAASGGGGRFHSKNVILVLMCCFETPACLICMLHFNFLAYIDRLITVLF